MSTKQLPYFRRVKEERRPGLEIQNRDIDILETVMKYRFLSSSQLKALYPQISERVLQDRLQKLYHNRFLNRPKGQRVLRILEGYRDLIYSLGPEGVSLLVHRKKIDRNKIKWHVNSAKALHLKHTLMISKFRVALTLACRSPKKKAEKRLREWKSEREAKKGKPPSQMSAKVALNRLMREEKAKYEEFRGQFIKQKGLDPAVRLKEWKQGKDIQDAVVIRTGGKRRRKRFPIAPDGFFHLYFPHKQKGDQHDYWFLEADRGTMSSKRFLKKMKAYWQYRFGGKRSSKRTGQKRLGVKDFRVLTVTPDQDRRELLRQVTRQANHKKRGSAMFWFGCEGDYSLDKPEDILCRIFQTPVDKRLRSILK